MSSDDAGFEFPNDNDDAEAQDFDEIAADLAYDAKESYEAKKQDQHELLDAVAEEHGAPLLETKCDIYGHVVPVSGRLNGEFIERVEELDEEAKRRADDNGAGGVSDIIRELAEIIDDLIDDPELTADGVYEQYRREGVMPVRALLDEVMDALEREQERVRGDADGFRKK